MRKIEPWFIRSLNDLDYEHDRNLKFDLRYPLWIHVNRTESIFTIKRYFCMYLIYESYIGQLNLNYSGIIKLVENDICSVDERIFVQGYISIYNEEKDLPELDISHFSSNYYFQPKIGNNYRIITKKPEMYLLIEKYTKILKFKEFLILIYICLSLHCFNLK